MTELRSGEGGSANTPPFPRVPSDDEAIHNEPGTTPENEPNLSSPPDHRSETIDHQLDASADGDTMHDGPDEARRARASKLTDAFRRRAEQGVYRRFETFADRLDEAAERLDQLADEHLVGSGPRGKAGDVAQSTAGWMEDAANYLRTTDFDRINKDLGNRVRERPFQSLFLAAATGWILGKIMR